MVKTKLNDKQLNLRGKIFQSFDQSGMMETSEYDFKNNIKNNQRADYAKNIKRLLTGILLNPIFIT